VSPFPFSSVATLVLLALWVGQWGCGLPSFSILPLVGSGGSFVGRGRLLWAGFEIYFGVGSAADFLRFSSGPIL